MAVAAEGAGGLLVCTCGGMSEATGARSPRPATSRLPTALRRVPQEARAAAAPVVAAGWGATAVSCRAKIVGLGFQRRPSSAYRAGLLCSGRRRVRAHWRQERGKGGKEEQSAEQEIQQEQQEHEGENRLRLREKKRGKDCIRYPARRRSKQAAQRKRPRRARPRCRSSRSSRSSRSPQPFRTNRNHLLRP
jgi:hypothetical protein